MKIGIRHFQVKLAISILCVIGCMAASQPAVSQALNVEAPVRMPDIARFKDDKNEILPCRIVFETDRDGNREIYVMEPDGSNPVNLTNYPADDIQPSWSPNGQWIAFISRRENEGEIGQFVYVMDSDGKNIRQLTEENGSEWPDWSPDGKRITYTHKGDIYAITADGSGQSVNLTNSPQEDKQSKWSPDGKQILWLAGKDDRFDIFTMNADGSNPKQLTQNAAVNDAAWSVDGRIFGHWDSKENGCFNCIMNADGTNITNAGGKGDIQKYLPFWTADGHRVELIAFDQFTGDNEIYLVSSIFPDTFLNITNNKANDWNPDWPAMCGNGRGAEVSAPAPSDVPEKTDPEPVDAKPIILGYAGDDGWNFMREHNFKRACEELNIRYELGTVEELLTRGVTAVIQDSGAFEADKLADEVKPAIDKGIPVFILDAETDIQGAYNVTINRREWVKASLGTMLETLKGKGQITYFDHGDAYDDAAVIKELLKKYPEIEVAEFQEGDFDPLWVKPQTNDVLQRNQGIDAVWTDGNPEMVVQGFQAGSHPEEAWPLFNCDANLAGLELWISHEKKDPDFNCAAPVNPPGIAYDAAYAAYYLASGLEIDPAAIAGPHGNTLYVPMPVITRENRQEWFKTLRGDAFFADKQMTPDEIKKSWFSEK